VLSTSTVNALLAAARAGSGEITGALEGEPLLAMEAGAASEVGEDMPAGLPCVVAVVADAPADGPPPAAADMALCPAPAGDAPPGWVAVDDPEAELARLRSQIVASPQAAVVLVQVLRAGSGLAVEQALMLESLAYSTLQAGPVFTAWLAQRPDPRRRAEPESAVLVERRGSCLAVTLHRPHVRNAVDTSLRDSLTEALALACADPSITEVELRGTGPDFSSGGDLDSFGSLPDPATAHLVRTARSPARLLAMLGPRVTAYVHGACVGAGIELAAFAGNVVAAPDTMCRLPEVSLGLLPGSGGTVSVPRRIGRQRTAWLAISGAELEVTRAARWGLVDEVSRPPT
jgi:enoyl-CoA hydratase/carnithine racemase